MKMIYLIVVITVWFVSFFGEHFSRTRRIKLRQKKCDMGLYVISKAMGLGLVSVLIVCDKLYPYYLDNLFWWIWIPLAIFGLILMMEARFHLRKQIKYQMSFFKSRFRRLILAGIGCLVSVGLVWYGCKIGQMIFYKDAYDIAEDYEETTIEGVELVIPGATGDKWIRRDRRQQPIFDADDGKIYFQFHGTDETMGSNLYLEMLHHGQWYRVKESSEWIASGKNYSAKQWEPLGADVLILDMEAFERVSLGKYRLRMMVHQAEKMGIIDEEFEIR